MLEDYDIVHFNIHWDGFKIEQHVKNMHNKKIRIGTTASTSSVFTHTRIPLFDLYTPANDKSWCQVRNALKSV